MLNKVKQRVVTWNANKDQLWVYYRVSVSVFGYWTSLMTFIFYFFDLLTYWFIILSEFIILALWLGFNVNWYSESENRLFPTYQNENSSASKLAHKSKTQQNPESTRGETGPGRAARHKQNKINGFPYGNTRIPAGLPVDLQADKFSAEKLKLGVEITDKAEFTVRSTEQVQKRQQHRLLRGNSASGTKKKQI